MQCSHCISLNIKLVEVKFDRRLKCVYLSPQQVQSGIHQSRLTWCDGFGAATCTSLPFSGAYLPPMLDLASQHAEGDGKTVIFLANNNCVDKIETPERQSDKPECASFPAVDVAKTQDYPSPQPIPEGKNVSLPVLSHMLEYLLPRQTVTQLYNSSMFLKIKHFLNCACVLAEMLCGWWRVADKEELHSLVKALHSRGIREKALQKQIQRHMEYTNQLCANSKDGSSTFPLLSSCQESTHMRCVLLAFGRFTLNVMFSFSRQ